ncbi:hypothetical protein M1L60_35590 [Actinoplanes sp. TRM 88003]|uniref:Uncharacterized protein n=1 Tax=Paractinoplanes aksuensis TaxID=2939490 RepID=A0ABT1E0W8_9ACTN|nr:hypothetical protein [Actinoplanes aksuensis]MCO8275916.1 hypothetical protein [Actinoplanes aksuensis]
MNQNETVPPAAPAVALLVLRYVILTQRTRTTIKPAAAAAHKPHPASRT